jgi:RND family efflux transporter MFP subunit
MRALHTTAGSLLLALLTGCGREVRTDLAEAAALPQVRTAAAGGYVAAVSEAGPAPPPATAATADARETAVRIGAVLYSEHDAEVASRVTRPVTSLAAELGDGVRAGQLLALLDDAEEQAAFESSAATLQLARLEQERAALLREREVISQAEADRAAYQLRAAEAAHQEARVRLEHTRIRAPFAGSVSRRFVRVGQSVEAGDPLFRVTALSPLRAQLRVPELAARGLAIGQSLRFRGPDGSVVEGRILRIAPAVDPASGTVEVLAAFPEPGALRPGSAVEAELPASGRGRTRAEPAHDG